MKEQSKIPSTKVQRAARFVRTGAKVGGNYVKHYTKKVFNPEIGTEELHEDNARDIYESLSELKGSALKVAQMMSMDKNVLPTAYQEKFAMAQYSAPPLSYPLVVKTFRKYFGKAPEQIYESFTKSAVNAASIGQVHKATLEGKELAIKIQYPGVASSVKSDLKLVKPFAMRLVNLNETELDHYMEEVEMKLLEETDYELEVRRSIEISEACADIPNLRFPKYYPELSSERVITMDWLEGKPLREFLKKEHSQEIRDQIGQALWDFYDFQIHQLMQVHADPHPGNFMLKEDGTLGVIDFGCVKVIPQDFYDAYFGLLKKEVYTDDDHLMEKFKTLQFIYDDDTEEDKLYFSKTIRDLIFLLGRPFHHKEFDFADESYFKEIFEMGEMLSEAKKFRTSKKARGARDGLYINRTYFGLYNLLHDLGAKVKTESYDSSSVNK
ncbi:ABC1 kinase family protein [Sediminitomix flava]|uniref:Putative unusual protein kinase regulating ubiquinone biosynthesis (AarF/ABC1/UbiB family) n=1 Tax=Sediminitomix flava TaxID=379075 RepID=A0A315YWN4_SEDFL|nr:AarF/ABC1/UbiB kinase family protein [Sediminitomix flava]PWJ34180.1 putative unusual protein kinase regulating ubiquinone biosynthesis (AarF/ABC1/UbiB family) [Sediminitomix flava]